MKSRSVRSSAESGTARALAARGYRGRFAPSPTGPLHLGSLVAALGSWLDARRAGGEWLLRIEDIDPPREVPGATASILRSLESHGLYWDGPVQYQSRHHARYREALEALRQAGRVFACTCSRRQLGPEGSCLGQCRVGPGVPAAQRLRCTAHGPVRFEDLILGEISGAAAALPPDFILWRKDGLPAYQLAVVVDDLGDRISHVLRGADLLESTARQLHLVDALAGEAPRYGHLPLAVDGEGRKLSKQTRAPAIDDGKASANLATALRCLGHSPPEGASREELLDHALRHWDRARVAAAGRTALVPTPGGRRLQDL